ncbi:hypothetical protein SKAU_G00062550 [Synaphobranchus kaupii]|uniref:Uncharacterized protein n=1 Tax=Synaphobranchus kaupii TaxID=118154 RepID=A0A9Q1JAV9_SYNKA|nr:hypothetical protein SKAU_G00062550 [Synaphobranchus kaupii]
MLSSALATMLAQPWSSRFRRQKEEPRQGKEEEELRQEVGDWARFLKPHRPFTGEASGRPDSNSITTLTSHPLTASQEQQVQDGDAIPGPDCRDGTPAGDRIALPPTPPETPCVTSTRSLDYQCYRRQPQTGSPGFLSPCFRDPSSLLSSKPTTSSLLLSLRRLSSTKGSPCTSSTLTNTPPTSPGSSTLPATSITLERPRLSGELSRGVSVMEGQLSPSSGRTIHRELTDWLDLLSAQSLMHKNTLHSSAWWKHSQQDDDHVTPSNTMVSTGNTMTGTNLNLLGFSNTATNYNLVSPNNNVMGPSNTTASTSHNILSPESTATSTNTTTFSTNHNFNSHGTYNRTLGILNTYNSLTTNTLNSPNTTLSPNTLNPNKNLTNPDTINSTNTPNKFNTLKSPNTPCTPISPNTHVSTNTSITPNTLRSPNTPFSPKTPIRTNISVSPNTPITYNTLRRPNIPLSPKTPISTNTSVSPNIPMNYNTLKSPNTPSTLFSTNNSSTYTPVSPNTPVTYNTLRSPNTPSTLFSTNNASSTYTPVSPNTPITPNILKSPNTPFSPKTPISTNTSVSPNTPITYNTLKSPRTPNTPFSTNTSSTYTPLSPNTPVTYNTLRSPNTPFNPKTPVSNITSVSPNTPITYNTLRRPNTPISTNTSISPNTLNRLDSPNILSSYKKHSDGRVGTVDSLGVYTINSPNTPISPKHIISPPYTCSTLNSTEVPRCFPSRTQIMKDSAKTNHTITSPKMQGIISSNAQLEGVATCSTDEGKRGPEALHWSISQTHRPSLGSTPNTMEEPIFSSLRTAGPCRRQSFEFTPSPCLSSPDPVQNLTPRRCHLSQGHKPTSRFTFDNAKDRISVISQAESALQNSPHLSSVPDRWVTPTPGLSSTHPLYSRDPQLPPSILSSHRGPRSLWAVPMDTTGDITSPHPCEQLSDMRRTSLPKQVSASAQLGAQPQRNTPACRKKSQDMFSFMPEVSLQPSVSGVGVDTGMGTDSMLCLSSLQLPQCKPLMSPHQSPASTDHFNQSLISGIGSHTNQDSERIGASLKKYAHSLPPPTACVPAARCATAFWTKPKMIVHKECDSAVDECNPAVSMMHQSVNRSPLMLRSGNSNLSPSIPGIAAQHVAPMSDGRGKAVGVRIKGSPKVDQVPSSITMTKHFDDEFLTARKNSSNMQDLILNMSSQVSEGDMGGEPGRWPGTEVLRPLNLENNTGSSKPGCQHEAQVTHLPTVSTQPGPVQDGSWHSLKDGNRNHSYQRYATFPGRPRSNETSWYPFDFNPEDVENENVFYNTATDTTYPRSQRKKSASFCEPEDARRAMITHGNSPGGPKAIQQESLYSPSPSSSRGFGLHHGRSFSVSSVNASRPSGCGRISTGPKIGSDHDPSTEDVDRVTLWGLVDLGGSIQQVTTRSFSFSLGQDTALERSCGPCLSEMPPSPIPTPPGSPRPTRRISSSSTTSRTSQGTASPRGRLPSRGYRSSLSAFEESGSDTTTDDEYYLSQDLGERETEL